MDKTKIDAVKDLRTESLRTLESDLVAEYQSIRTEELSVSSVTELADISAAIQTVRAELAEREVAEAEPTAEELAAAVADADAAVAAVPEAKPAEAELTAEEPAEEADAKDEAPAADAKPAEAEPVVAAAEETVELSPTDVETGDLGEVTAVATITAGGDIPGVAMGAPLADMHGVAKAFMARRKTFRGLSPEGDGDDVIVASIQGDYPEERRLGKDAETNMAKIDAVASPAALTASGGLCAPLEPYYGIQVIADAARPVRDSLPKFSADRGGVRFIPPPVLSDVSGAIGVTTAAQDVGPYGDSEGDTPFKPCLHVACGEEQEVEVAAIHRCLTFGNFAARTYPEQVEAWLALAIAAHARRAETLLLDAIDAASTATTGASTYSAVRTLLPQIDVAVAAYRSRNRTSQNLALRIMLPAWTKELLRADLARGYQGHDTREVLAVSDAEIAAWFSVRNVTPTFYVDGATGSSQIFGAQSAGALSAFPSTVVWYLFVEGSFVFLDGGVLDLGLVRDSTLNKTNDYQIFAETFEAVAFYGIESVKVTSTVCPNGVSAPAASGSAPC
jgi:hypothetical protein